MTNVNIADIETAFEFVNLNSYNDNSAAVNRETGEIHYFGDSVDEELPEDFDEEDEVLVWIPEKGDLYLASEFAMDFSQTFCSEVLNDVQLIFSRRGAYSHFRRLLEEKNLLDKWYKFEEEKKRDALLKWCRENKIEAGK